MTAAYQLQPVGVIRSPWKEKFAIPRQPGLIEDGDGELHLHAPWNQEVMLRGLESFSHLWVIFIFHQTASQWHPTVRPPRLGGNTRVGVFATRSPFRPNPIGLSLVRFKGSERRGKTLVLHLGSVDLLDGTPVLDIKPYLPFAESLPEASGGFAEQPPPAEMQIRFSAEAEQQLARYQPRYPTLRRFLSQVLAQDPRPAYHKKQPAGRIYAVRLLEFDVRWRILSPHEAEVVAIVPQ